MAKRDKKEIKNNKDKTSFMKSFKAELKKVNWPTPKQLFNNTVAVLTIVLITAIIVFILDLAFESANKYGIDKIKQAVSNSASDETTDSEEAENNTEDESQNEIQVDETVENGADENTNISTEEDTNTSME